MSKSAKGGAKGRLTTRDKVIVGISIGLIVCSLIAVAIIFLMNYRFFEDKSGGNQPGPIITEQIQTPNEIQEKVVTFLVLGIGDDPDERENTMLTDTIMVATVDMEKKKVSVLQIPRDTYVGNETPTGKINAIYKQDSGKWDYAGLKGLTKMIYEMFQLNIDHYVTIQMDGFEELVDLIGGVTMNVPKNMELNGTYVKAGEQTLTGKQAIAVVRTRNVYANADLGRLDTQKIFLSALVQKCMNLDVVTMTKLIPTMLTSLTTDLTANDALGYYEMATGLDLGNISIATVPGAGAMVNGQSVYCVYKEQVAKLLNDNFRPYSTQVTADQLLIQTVLKDPAPTSSETGDDDGMIHFDDYSSGAESGGQSGQNQKLQQ